MATCYDLHLGAININYSDLPCEDVSQVGHNVTCCVRGSVCMSNGICQNADKNGYYSADCTDPTLQDPICQNRCGGLAGSQITYNSTSGLWACCSYNGGKSNCSEPTDQLFPAPGPSSLTSLQYLPTTGSATYSTLATSISTSSNTALSSCSSSSSNIGSGAAAGIGVGAGVGVIIIATAVAFLISKRRRNTQTDDIQRDVVFPASTKSDPWNNMRELDNKPLARELDGEDSLPELPSGH
ncbi:hypothetical protein N7494_009693 [Penicillium frequentans]|uniref:Uncharacterized protein n=1 Tax=Penicillium frequentans TaxID=3151616 RepID=A0AAD6CQC5_9EURO|nr:hypothetical protein N7494_009693 [Penicillium glabrum]